MKKRIIFSVLLGLLTAAFVLNSGTTAVPPPAPNNNISDEFLIGALDNGWDVSYNYINSTLGFNVWHKYCDVETISGKNYPTGWIHNGAQGDLLFTDETYISQVQGVLDNINNHNMKALMHRPKLEYLCYGQRSDYQCEDIPANDPYWFYSFQSPSHVGTSITTDEYPAGVFQNVRYCSDHDNPNGGMVVSRLKANTEQCHTDVNDGSKFRWDSQCDWLIKPRIRADQDYINNHFNEPICRVDVYNQDGNKFKEVLIRARNFQDAQGHYDGYYHEEFNFDVPNGDSTLTYTGDWLGTDTEGKWVYKARGNNTNEQTVENHVDIQVYWYGSCDMWIDYVRVDNDAADMLLNPNNQFYSRSQDWLLWEAQDVGDYGSSPLEFYIELLEFNQIPCIAYVNEKLDSYSNGRHLKVMAETLWGFEFHMPYSAVGELVTVDKINSMYFEKTNSREIFVGDPYPINAAPPVRCYGNYQQFSVIPSTLPWTSGDSVFAVTASPANYDRWLTGLFDTVCTFYETTGGSINNYQFPGVYLYLLKRGDAVSKLRNIPLIAMVQAHQWINSGEVDREPTNEELEMMTNLAVSYGARGIMFWGFGSYYGDDCNNMRGIMKSDMTPRDTNVYGQPKLQKFQEIVGKLKTWGPTLMSFNNADRHSYIYRLYDERYSFLTNSYFNRIASFKDGNPLNSCVEGDAPPHFDNLEYECQENTYLQAATFKKTNDDGNLYFMLVNRRCSPVKNGYPDGKRKIKVLFDVNHSDMAGHNSWNIRDLGLENVPVVASFSKLSGQWVDLGDYFEPGEGRLFKLEPVAGSGGVLQGDETIPSGNYTILDTIFTNGYDLTIEEGAHLYFTDTSTIVVDGGKLTAGTVSEGQPNVFFTAASGNTFHGLNFTGGAEVKIYKSSFSGLANDTTYAVNIISCPLIDIRNSSFSSGSNTLSGAINITYYSEPVINNIYIGGNTFDAGTSSIPFVNLMSYAGTSTPALIENNTFTSTSGACRVNS